jgi:hypothetical protein
MAACRTWGLALARRQMNRLVGLVGVGVVLCASSCADPCVVLAERICNCEPTFATRRACVADRITNQQGRIEVTDADREACSAALETCTCAALDQNELSACGMTPDTEG